MFLMQIAVLLVVLVSTVTDASTMGNQTGENLLGGIDDIGVDFDNVFTNIVNGGLKVRLFAIYGNTFTLVVAPSGPIINFDSTYIFKQDISTLDSNYQFIRLMPPYKFKVRYPDIFGQHTSMVGLHDATDEYIIFINENNFTYLNAASGEINLAPISYWISYTQNPVITLSKPFTVWFYHIPEPAIDIACFAESPWTKTPILHWGPYICSSGLDSIIFPMGTCQNAVNWLKVGFADDQKIVIFDQDNTVIVFPRSAYDNPTGMPVAPLHKTAAIQFWTKFQFPTTASPPPPPSTEEVSSAVTESIGTSVRPTRSLRLHKFLAPIAIGLLLLLAFLIICCFCTGNRKPAKGEHVSGLSKSKQAKGHSDTDSGLKNKTKTQTKAESSAPISKYKETSGHTNRSSRNRRRSANRAKRSIAPKAKA